MNYSKYIKLALISLASAAVTLFVDDMRADDIAERAAEKAVKRMKEEPKALPQKNRAERRLASRKGR